MKDKILFIIQDKTSRILLFMGLVAGLIPVNKIIIPGFLGLTFLACLFPPKIDISRRFLPLFVLSGIFILHLIGLLYTEHYAEGTKELEYKLSYIVFPVLAIFIPVFSEKARDWLLDLFAIGSIVFALNSIWEGLVFYQETGELAQLSYGELSHPFHPTYMAVYHVFFATWFFKRLSLDMNVGRQLLYGTGLVISGAYVIMLASKAGILSLGIPIVFGCFFFIKTKRIKRLFLVMGVFMLSIVASYKLIPTSSQRIETAVQTVTKGTTDADSEMAHSSVKLRQVIWTASLEVIIENPFGVGTGDTTPELVKKYRAMGEDFAAEKNLNCHNQFLQVTCEHGWIALLLLVTGMAMMILRSIKTKDWIFLAFLLICGLNFLFESFLEVQAGIVFFFYFCLVFLNRKEPQAS
jgi:O-antigen ligase